MTSFKKFVAALAIGLLQSAAWADFIAVGHPNYSPAQGHLFVLGAPGATGAVSSNDGALDQTFTIGPTGVVEILVPDSQFLSPDNVVLNRALRVTSGSPKQRRIF